MIEPRSSRGGLPGANPGRSAAVAVFAALAVGAGCATPRSSREPGSPSAPDGRSAAVAPPLPDQLGTARWRHPGLETLAVSRDGRRLLSSAGHGDALLWDAATGVVLHRFATGGAGVALSADGKRVAVVASGWGEGRIEVAAATGGERTSVTVSGEIAALALDPTGTALAVGTARGAVELFDVATGGSSWRVDGHGDAITALVFAGPSLVVSAGKDGAVTLWRRGDGGRAASLTPSPAPITALAATPNGDQVAAAGQGGAVWLYATRGGVIRQVLATGGSYPIVGLALSPDGRRAAIGSHSGELSLWATDTGKRVARLIDHATSATAVAISGDGTIYGGSGAGVIRRWSRSGVEVALEPRGNMAPVAHLVLAGPDRLVAAGGSREVVIWDLTRRREVARLGGHDDVVRAVAATGRRVATGGYDQQIRVWDLDTGKSLAHRFGHEVAVTALAFSTDGAWLASGGANGSVTVQRADLSALGFVRHDEDNAITAIAWSPSGDLVGFGDSFGNLTLVELGGWDGRSSSGLSGANVEPTGQRVVARIGDSYPDAVSWLGFSPDGSRFATTSGDTLRIYDTATVTERVRLTTSGFTAADAAWCPRRDEIGFGDSDGNLWLVDPERGEILAHVRRAHDKFEAIAYADGGDTLLASRRDTTVALWSVEADVRGHAADQATDEPADDQLEVVVAPPAPSRRIPPPPCPDPIGDRWGDALPRCAVQRLGSGRLRADHDISALAVSPDGGLVAASSDQNETVQVWRLSDGVPVLSVWGSEIGTDHLAFVGPHGLIGSDSVFARLRRWDVASGRQDGVAAIRAVALAVSPDGATVAVSDLRAGAIRLLGSADLRERRRWKPEGDVVPDRLVFSPDGRRLAAGFEGWVRLYDPATGAAIDLGEDVEPVGVPGFTAAGRLILASEVAASIRGDDGAFTEHPYRLPRGFPADAVSVTAAGTVLVTGDDQVAVWDSARPAAPAELVSVGRFSAVQGTADRDTLLVVRELAMERWSVAGRRAVLSYPGHDHWVRWVGATVERGFTCDGTTVREWRLDDGALVGERPGGNAVALAPAGGVLAVAGDKQVTLYALSSGRHRALAVRDSGFASQIALSADGRYLLSTEDATHVAVSLFDTRKRRRLRSFGRRGDGWIDQVAISADGGLIAWADGARVELYRAGGHKVATLDHGEDVAALAFSRDGALIATAGDRGVIRLWTTATGAATGLFEGHRSRVGALGFGPGDRRLVAGDLYGEVWVWDLGSGRPVVRVPGHGDVVTSIAFAGDSSRFLSGSWDATALVWDLAGFSSP